MPDPPSQQAYLELAGKLFDGQITESDLSAEVGSLPSLDEARLKQLAQCSEVAAPSRPRLAWAIAAIAEAAAVEQGAALFLRSLAAWYLGRAANHWVQPKRVAAAIARARQGFEQLGQPGWMAACEWQANLLSWTKTDITKAADSLQAALSGLQRAGLGGFEPHCRLSLAYAQILTNQTEAARENMCASEIVFAAQGDAINQARCWWTEASLLRRQSRFGQALDRLEGALHVFRSADLPVDIAKTYYQSALVHILQTDDLPRAISDFERAAAIFKECGLDLWQAAIETYLGSVYLQNGRFGLADECLQRARGSFEHHHVLGLLADNLNDSGKLNARRGLHSLSLKQYQQAKAINDQLGSKKQAALARMNLGEAYGQLGRYQDALHYLEQAAQELLAFGDYLRLGTCARYIAAIWLLLGELPSALEHLDAAAEYYEKAGQKAYFATIQRLRAGLFFRQGLFSESILWLEKSLDTARLHNIEPQIALAQRQLGEVYLQTGQHAQAKDHLEGALARFIEMGMVMEEAASLAALGDYHLEAGAHAEAESAFEKALSLSQGDFPESDWRAQDGLAQLSKARHDLAKAMRAYRDGIHALGKIRQNFWQPALAGSYLQSPASFFDTAVSFAAANGQAEAALEFIESSKATTLLRQLSTHRSAKAYHSHELDNLRGEINWLQEHLRASSKQTGPLQFALQSHQMRLRLAEKTREYDSLLAQLERQQSASATLSQPPFHFTLTSFRTAANHRLGDSWLALDYYLTEEQLITIMVSPQLCQVHTAPRSARVEMALSECQKPRGQSGDWPGLDLAILESWLLPSPLAELLTPESVILIAPHRELHSIPWAALQPAFSDQPLACLCVPDITPSLQSLALLWARAAATSPPHPERGLVIGLSRFPNAQDDLPAVRDEIAALQSQLDPQVRFLLDEEAAWEQVQRLAQQDQARGLARFAWLHFAGHAFSDAHSGRLGGFSLWDGDIRLDQLQDLAPLPNLMTFSACNSLYSFFHTGDEPVGLPATCLIGGANSVMGSVWPIFDQAAHNFTLAFYRHFLECASPARAVALAQRELIAKREALAAWASFTCLGMP